ncbi:hypothetical protein MXB_2711 [Myxobolus squamalis]|nr:hypothetical protein MXB_2711 [Myxobolus squamalis]
MEVMKMIMIKRRATTKLPCSIMILMLVESLYYSHKKDLLVSQINIQHLSNQYGYKIYENFSIF